MEKYHSRNGWQVTKICGDKIGELFRRKRKVEVYGMWI